MERSEIGFSREAAKEYKKLPKGYKSSVDVALSRLPEDMELDPKPAKGDRGVANEAQGQGGKVQYRKRYTLKLPAS